MPTCESSLTAGEEVATLTALGSIVSGPARLPAASGGPWARAQEARPRAARGIFVTVVADAEQPAGLPGGDPGRAAALIALTQALNGPTRCALSLLRAGGNRTGADAVTTWQTGYPAGVDFARGYPLYRPHDGAAARLCPPRCRRRPRRRIGGPSSGGCCCDIAARRCPAL